MQHFVFIRAFHKFIKSLGFGIPYRANLLMIVIETMMFFTKEFSSVKIPEHIEYWIHMTMYGLLGLMALSILVAVIRFPVFLKVPSRLKLVKKFSDRRYLNRKMDESKPEFSAAQLPHFILHEINGLQGPIKGQCCCEDGQELAKGTYGAHLKGLGTQVEIVLDLMQQGTLSLKEANVRCLKFIPAIDSLLMKITAAK